MRTYKISTGAVGKLDAFSIRIPRNVAENFDAENDRFVCKREGNQIIFTQVQLVEKSA